MWGIYGCPWKSACKICLYEIAGQANKKRNSTVFYMSAEHHGNDKQKWFSLEWGNLCLSVSSSYCVIVKICHMTFEKDTFLLLFLYFHVTEKVHIFANAWSVSNFFWIWRYSCNDVCRSMCKYFFPFWKRLNTCNKFLQCAVLLLVPTKRYIWHLV